MLINSMQAGLISNDSNEAVGELSRLYSRETERLVSGYKEAIKSGVAPQERLRGFYPEVVIDIVEPPRSIDRGQSHGFCANPGLYRATITRPDIMGSYYREQFALIAKNHPEAKFRVGLSQTPIPMSFAINDNVQIQGEMSEGLEDIIESKVDFPQNYMFFKPSGKTAEGRNIYPLLWFTAAQMDRSFNFLTHYTATSPKLFRDRIAFTNYGDYMEAFEAFAMESINGKPQNGEAPYVALVKPGNVIVERPEFKGIVKKLFNIKNGSKPKRDPQMPALHLIRQDGTGISMMNIGVGPSNAKTATDHIAVLRPKAWFMVGHCAGLCSTQRKGDYVIPNGYVFEDGLMEKIMGTNVSIPELAEMHQATKSAVRAVLDQDKTELRESVRTGIVTTTADRNWEAPDNEAEYEAMLKKFGANNSIALDMESAVIAANGFRLRVPYGVLLCVSDRPLHGEIKMAGAAQTFYRRRTIQQFDIARLALENLDQVGSAQSRKMRSDFAYTPVL